MKDLINKELINGVYYLKNNWVNLNISQSLEIELIKSLYFFRPETYFNYLFAFVYHYEYGEKGKTIIDKNVVFEIFLEASKKILKEECAVISPIKEGTCNQVDLSFFRRDRFINFISEIKFYKSTVLDYVNDTPATQISLGIEPDENPYHSEKSIQFFQNMMFIGYSIAVQRIRDELYNESYFGVEIIDFKKQTDLLIYLTPEGMIKGKKLYEMSKEEKIKIYNDFLSRKNIKRIESKYLQKELFSPIILNFENNLFYHYQQSEPYSNDFISKKINKQHISSLFTESQANYLMLE